LYVRKLLGTGFTVSDLPFVIFFLNIGEIRKKMEWGTDAHRRRGDGGKTG
jgi:hypothetical protein